MTPKEWALVLLAGFIYAIYEAFAHNNDDTDDGNQTGNTGGYTG